jgi:glucose-6-phosphate isomerase
VDRDGEEKWLGWLDIVERQAQDLANLAELGADVETGGFKTVLLLGMGGSSLCPEVLAETFGQQPEFPALHIVDSTDPAQVKAVRDKPEPQGDAGDRGQQIRLHAGTEHPEAVFL